MGRSSSSLSSLMTVLSVALCVQTMMLGLSRGADDDKLRNECMQQIQQLGNCLMFATGKDPNPTKPCCDTITDIKNKQPVCLCYFIEQAHNGSQTIKSLGIQESRLLQLPSACHLANANLTICPALLGISPSSPAAAIFMNNNATTFTSSNDQSDALKVYGNGALLLVGLIITVLITILPIATMKI